MLLLLLSTRSATLPLRASYGRLLSPPRDAPEAARYGRNKVPDARSLQFTLASRTQKEGASYGRNNNPNATYRPRLLTDRGCLPTEELSYATHTIATDTIRYATATIPSPGQPHHHHHHHHHHHLHHLHHHHPWPSQEYQPSTSAPTSPLVAPPPCCRRCMLGPRQPLRVAAPPRLRLAKGSLEMC